MIIGFGNLDDLEELGKIAKETGEKPLVESHYTSEEQSKLDNVMVPILENKGCVECGYMEEQEEMEKHEELEHHEHPEHHEEDAKATGASGNEANLPSKEKKAGDSSYPPKKDEKEDEAILGGFGLSPIKGGGIKKEMAQMEGFTPKEIVDEEPMEVATDRTTESKMDKVEKVKEIFNDVFEKKFGKDKEYDFDGSVAKSTTSQTPITKIPKGW